VRKTRQRRRAYRRGLSAEKAAAWWLRLKGYRILARRFSVAVGEIDLIAKRGSTVCFVEVKARRDPGRGLAAITPRQAKRIARAAEAFQQARPDLSGCDIRFDAVVVTGLRPPTHLPDAWRLDG